MTSSARLNLAKSESVITNAQVMTDSPLTVLGHDCLTSLTPGPYGVLRGRARPPAALPGGPIYGSKVQQQFRALVRTSCRLPENTYLLAPPPGAELPVQSWRGFRTALTW